MTHPFRTTAPFRSYTGKQKNDYHKYKNQLASDFHHRCGYTDCQDHWFGGQRTFQIDHLQPWSKYPDRKNDYSNLVYCCSYVNRAKSNDDSPNYLDPCDNDYNNHFFRDKDGCIHGKTEQGKYMAKQLCLSLRRYAIMWNLDRLEERIDRIRQISEQRPELKPILSELLLLYFDYIHSLRLHQ